MAAHWSLLMPMLALVSQLAHGEPTVASLLPPTPRTIAVSGGAEVRVVPDEVHLRFSVEERNRDLHEAVKECDAHTKALLDFLVESGLDEKDVQSDFIEINPEYKVDRGVESLVPEHFSARRGFVVRLRQLRKFDALLAGILQHGAKRVQDVEFRTTELRRHRDLARQKAIRAAREKAVALAGELEATVGKPQSIQEVTGGGVGGRPRLNAVSQNVSHDNGAGVELEDRMVAAGMISVTSSVHVVFFLE